MDEQLPDTWPRREDYAVLPGAAQQRTSQLPMTPPVQNQPPERPMNLQDWLALSYMATALGGAVGQAFRKGIPPPPIGIPQSSPPPPTTPTATQASLGLAQVRRSGRGGFGRG